MLDRCATTRRNLGDSRRTRRTNRRLFGPFFYGPTLPMIFRRFPAKRTPRRYVIGRKPQQRPRGGQKRFRVFRSRHIRRSMTKLVQLVGKYGKRETGRVENTPKKKKTFAREILTDVERL